MRCLQCGKAVPLIKRLAGNEFCSDAHRREYQHEFSQLALGRLLQHNSPGARAQLVKAPALTRHSAPIVDEPPPIATPVETEQTRPAIIPAAKSNGATKSPPPPEPVKKVVPLPAVTQPATPTAGATQPATAKAAAIQKPAPAAPRFARVADPEFEHAFASLAPDRPRRQADVWSAELPHGQVIEGGSRIGIIDSPPRLHERKLDLREVSRATPRIALDLRIVPPESLESEKRPLPVTATPAAPREAGLWIAPYCNFVGELVSLSAFADAVFSKSGFEAPAPPATTVSAVEAPVLPTTTGSAVEAPALPTTSVSTLDEPVLPLTTVSAVDEPMLPEPQPAAVESEPESEAPPALMVRVPDPQLSPLPVSWCGVTPGKAKPLAVFGPIPTSTGTVQIPQPNGLPLRPVMLLVPTAVARVEAKPGEGNILGLRADSAIKPEIEPNPNSAGPLASWPRKILAGLTGATMLGAGIFFFLGKQSDAGLKSAAPTFADGTPGGQWITNFAPDAKRQRRVSLLRSSMNLSAYRLEFESSIRIKALGWVYRARDSKNFYVSKIEFLKPGLNPVYGLVHYAVINGVDQPRVETPLHVTVPMGGHYKIRFEAVGNTFTTWVQGQRAEQWTDARLPAGGAGLFGEGAEQSILHGDFNVTPLK